MAAGAPQTETKSVVTIDFANSPELMSLFSKKSPGDPCELTLKMNLMTKTEAGVKLSLTKVIAEDYEGQDAEVDPDSDEPVMISMKNRRKNRKAAPADEAPPSLKANPVAMPVQNSEGSVSYA